MYAVTQSGRAAACQHAGRRSLKKVRARRASNDRTGLPPPTPLHTPTGAIRCRRVVMAVGPRERVREVTAQCATRIATPATAFLRRREHLWWQAWCWGVGGRGCCPQRVSHPHNHGWIAQASRERVQAPVLRSAGLVPPNGASRCKVELNGTSPCVVGFGRAHRPCLAHSCTAAPISRRDGDTMASGSPRGSRYLL